MILLRLCCAIVVAGVWLGASRSGVCAVIQYQFTGTITAAFDNDPGTSPDEVFGAVVAPGDPVSGFFSYDTSAAVTATLGSVGASYHQNLPFLLEVVMDGVVFRSDGLFDTSVINDLVPGVGQPPLDIFAIGDGVEGSQTDTTGTTLLVGGVSTDGKISLQFNDSSATAFSSTSLPAMLDLNDFSSTEGRINGTTGGGSIFHFATFSVDSLTHASNIPEPGSFVLIATGLTGIWIRNRRRTRYPGGHTEETGNREGRNSGAPCDQPSAHNR